MDQLDKLGVQHDLGVENLGDWTVLLGVSRQIGEFCFVEVGHFGAQRQSRTANGELSVPASRRVLSRLQANSYIGLALPNGTPKRIMPAVSSRFHKDAKVTSARAAGNRAALVAARAEAATGWACALTRGQGDSGGNGICPRGAA